MLLLIITAAFSSSNRKHRNLHHCSFCLERIPWGNLLVILLRQKKLKELFAEWDLSPETWGGDAVQAIWSSSPSFSSVLAAPVVSIQTSVGRKEMTFPSLSESDERQRHIIIVSIIMHIFLTKRKTQTTSRWPSLWRLSAQSFSSFSFRLCCVSHVASKELHVHRWSFI